MLRLYVKIDDLLLEGETYPKIMEELRFHAFDSKKDVET